jgi:hypothetical protein
MNKPLFNTSPNALSDVIRNAIVARAIAGTYDPSETTAKAIQACRATARNALHMGRLNPAQAAEVDVLVHEARVQAQQNPALRSALSGQAYSPAALAMAQNQTATSTFDAETGKEILAAVKRFERILWTLVVMLAKHFRIALPAAEAEQAEQAFGSNDAPSLAAHPAEQVIFSAAPASHMNDVQVFPSRATYMPPPALPLHARELPALPAHADARAIVLRNS